MPGTLCILSKYLLTIELLLTPFHWSSQVPVLPVPLFLFPEARPVYRGSLLCLLLCSPGIPAEQHLQHHYHWLSLQAFSARCAPCARAKGEAPRRWHNFLAKSELLSRCLASKEWAVSSAQALLAGGAWNGQNIEYYLRLWVGIWRRQWGSISGNDRRYFWK